MVMEGIEEDIGDGINMQCTNHPYKNSSPGGICAFCLQEKLGKLVSSSFTSAVFPASSSSSSSTPSFRSDLLVTSNTTTTTVTSALPLQTINQTSDCNNNNYDAIRKSIMPFMLSTQKKEGPNSASGSGNNIAFKRSKSTATPRNRLHFMDSEDYNSPQKKGFWSYVYYSSSSKHSSTAKKGQPVRNVTFPSSSTSSVNDTTVRTRDKKKEEIVVVEENESPDQATFDRKVSRSRSVGCGSRSFSGEFFERITGFGDCTLRRVESQREGKPSNKGQDCNIKERVKCGGIFSGFMITSSSSSSSSSSYWVSSEENVNGIKSITGHGRTNNNKSWGWAFASPMRAFSKPSSSSSSNGKRKASSNKNVTPNLSAIPSLLTVRS